MPREGQRQEGAGQTAHNAPRAGPADDLLPGKPSRSLLQRRHLTLRNPRSEALCAPSRIRTCGLLLRSNPAADAVANWDNAGQVSGGTHCCSPSYLVIAAGQAATVTVQAGQGDRIRQWHRPLYRPWAITPDRGLAATSHG